MKVEDLMIGDWVRLKDDSLSYEESCMKITFLSNSTICSLKCTRTNAQIGLIKPNEDWLCPVFDDDIEPIPLTPEILEKNGFENIDNKYPFPTFRCDDKENYICITIGFPEGDKTKRKRPFIEINSVNIYIEHLIINFVHQLQHALKLCGIDKEIVL